MMYRRNSTTRAMLKKAIWQLKLPANLNGLGIKHRESSVRPDVFATDDVRSGRGGDVDEGRRQQRRGGGPRRIIGDLACASARPRRKGARANERRASETRVERVEGAGGRGGERHATDR